MKMTEQEMRVLKRQMLISDLNDTLKNSDRERFLKAMKKEDYSYVWWIIISVILMAFLNSMGLTELEKYL